MPGPAKIVWAWKPPYNKSESLLRMGVPRYEGIYGWQLLESGQAYCQYCHAVVTAPHSHTKQEIDNYKQYGTIAENGSRDETH